MKTDAKSFLRRSRLPTTFYVAKLFELKLTVSVFEYNSLKRIY